MKNNLAILLACLISCAQAHAASFDCAKARSVSEQLICKDEQLSELDEDLGRIYMALQRSLGDAKAAALRQEQTRWLRSTRDRCASVSCLMQAYRRREYQLNPYADKKLTCKEMRESPDYAFSGGMVDLGSGAYSPVEIDFNCPQSLAKQPYMQKLLSLSDRIHGQDGPRLCSGSIVYVHWRGHQFRLTSAGYFPESSRREGEKIFAGMNWAALMAAPVVNEDGERIRYFRQWSEQSRGNFALYSAFAAEFDRVLPVLALYYETKMGRPRAQAQEAAKLALLHVLGHASGSSPSSDFHPDSAIVEQVRLGASPEQLRRLIAGGPERLTDTQIYEALVVALIHDRPVPVVAALAESLAPAALVELGKDKEPLLSLAIGNQQNLDYLLRLKTPVSLVNAANDFGKTALFHAIGARDQAAVAALLKAGANVNQAYKSQKELRPDEDICIHPVLEHTRRTPLMHAAQHAGLPILKMLVQAGARVDAVDDLNTNAVNYAITGKKKDNERYLRSLGLVAAASK